MKAVFLVAVGLILTSCNMKQGQEPIVMVPNPHKPFALSWVDHTRKTFGSTSLLGNDFLLGRNDDIPQYGTGVGYNLLKRKIEWKYTPSFSRDPGIAIESYFVVSSSTGLNIVEQATGKIVEVIPFPGGVNQSFYPINSPVDILGDQVYIPTDGSVLVYSATDLLRDISNTQPLWIAKTGDNKDLNTFAVDHTTGNLYIGYRTGVDLQTTIVKAFNREGSSIWEKEIYVDPYPGGLAVNVGADKGKVVILLNGRAGWLATYDSAGNQLWKNPQWYCPDGGGTNFYNSVSVHGNLIVLSPLGDHCISGWDAQTGKKKWVLDGVAGTFDNRPLLLNGVLYASNTLLWAWDAETGEVLARSDERLFGAQGANGTVHYDSKRDQLLVWAESLWAYKPVR